MMIDRAVSECARQELLSRKDHGWHTHLSLAGEGPVVRRVPDESGDRLHLVWGSSADLSLVSLRRPCSGGEDTVLAAGTPTLR